MLLLLLSYCYIITLLHYYKSLLYHYYIIIVLHYYITLNSWMQQETRLYSRVSTETDVSLPVIKVIQPTRVYRLLP